MVTEKKKRDLMSIAAAARESGAPEKEIGLWISKGRIETYATPGGGNKVRLSELRDYMRSRGMDSADADIEALDAQEFAYAQGAILIVDDDAMVRGMVVQILNPSYPLYEASDGYQALEKIRQEDSVNLVLLDIRMPGQSGIETYEQIKAIRPDVAVVIVSGYIEDVPDKMMADSSVCGIIEKPVSEDLLLDTVARAMEHRGTV